MSPSRQTQPCWTISCIKISTCSQCPGNLCNYFSLSLYGQTSQNTLHTFPYYVHSFLIIIFLPLSVCFNCFSKSIGLFSNNLLKLLEICYSCSIQPCGCVPKTWHSPENPAKLNHIIVFSQMQAFSRRFLEPQPFSLSDGLIHSCGCKYPPLLYLSLKFYFSSQQPTHLSTAKLTQHQHRRTSTNSLLFLLLLVSFPPIRIKTQDLPLVLLLNC